MPANLVPVSDPVARNSPYNRINMHTLLARSQSTNFRFELGELKPSTIKLEYVYRLGRVGLFVRLRRRLDVSRVFSLSACQHYASSMLGWARATLQFLHFQTKLASPLLPLISFCSKRLIETKLGCVSRHEVHWTLNV
jgi:hypothetical protein